MPVRPSVCAGAALDARRSQGRRLGCVPTCGRIYLVRFALRSRACDAECRWRAPHFGVDAVTELSVYGCGLIAWDLLSTCDACWLYCALDLSSVVYAGCAPCGVPPISGER
jgi:hypothetical protein